MTVADGGPRPQEYNRFWFWAAVPELQGRYLRVLTVKRTPPRAPRTENAKGKMRFLCESLVGERKKK